MWLHTSRFRSTSQENSYLSTKKNSYPHRVDIINSIRIKNSNFSLSQSNLGSIILTNEELTNTMENTTEKKGLNISVRSFITAIAVLFVLMIMTYVLTFIVPGGEIPFWKWALSPVLVLGGEDNVSLIAVIAFLL